MLWMTRKIILVYCDHWIIYKNDIFEKNVIKIGSIRDIGTRTMEYIK